MVTSTTSTYNRLNWGAFQLFLALMLIIPLNRSVYAQNEELYYDFAAYEEGYEEPQLDASVEDKLFRIAYGQKWKKLEVPPQVSSVVAGSFTKENARQKLVIVDHGWHGPGTGQLGAHWFILDASNRVLEHKWAGGASRVLKVSDLDENGLNEVLIDFYEFGMGYLNVKADIWAYTSEAFRIVHSFGEMYHNDCSASGQDGAHSAVVRIHKRSYDLSSINWSISWNTEPCEESEF